MKTISTYFAMWLLMMLSNITNAQTGEMASNNTLTGKEHLPYAMIPEIWVWEKIAGLEENAKEETADISALYNKKDLHIIINGTDRGGDIEVWDVEGNTIFERMSGKPKTEFKAGNLPRGSYYINYSNGSISEGVKLTVH